MQRLEKSPHLFGRPFFPKRLCNIYIALALLCAAITAQSMMVSGALPISINMIERSFRYNSVQSGSIDTVYNVAFAVSAFILSYVGKQRKTFWLGLGCSIMALGCVTFILPHFINYSSTTLQPISILCQRNYLNPPTKCVWPSLADLAIMCFAYALIGIGGAPLHTLGVSYLDEHTTEGQSGFFTGIYYVFAAVGPALTYILSKPLLNIPLNLVQEAGSFLTPDSENWTGAYWIIYLFGSSLLLIITFPLLLFPSYLSTRKKQCNSNKDDATSVPQYTFQNFIHFSVQLVRNAPYMLVNLGMVSEGIMSNAVATFLPKFIEAQFTVSSGTASLYSGVLVVCGAVSGMFLGGLLIKKYQWPMLPLVLRIAIASLVGTVSMFFFFLRCPTTEVMGISSMNAKFVNFTSNCSSSCGCNPTHYFPVCFNTTKTFYSACAAGCTEKEGPLGQLSFSRCDCLYDDPLVLTKKATQGGCSGSCTSLPAFMVLGFVAMVLTFITYIPILRFTIRVSGDNLSLFALGFQQIQVRMAFIIGPIIYGAIIDRSCNLFQPVDGCQSTTSNCLRYDLTKFSYYIALASITCKTVATMCHFCAYFTLRKKLKTADEGGNATT